MDASNNGKCGDSEENFLRFEFYPSQELEKGIKQLHFGGDLKFLPQKFIVF